MNTLQYKEGDILYYEEGMVIKSFVCKQSTNLCASIQLYTGDGVLRAKTQQQVALTPEELVKNMNQKAEDNYHRTVENNEKMLERFLDHQRIFGR